MKPIPLNPDTPKTSFFQTVRLTFLGLFGKLPVASTEEVARLIKDGAMLLDVRNKTEVIKNPVAGALNIPVLKLNEHLPELPHDKTIITFCHLGGRAEQAKLFLEANGFKVVNGGGYKEVGRANAE